MPFIVAWVLLHAWVAVRIAGELLLPHAAGAVGSAAPAPAWSLALGALVALALAASSVLAPWAFLRRRTRRAHESVALTWAALLLMGLFSTLFVLTVLRDLLLLVVHAVALFARTPLPAGSIEFWSAVAVPALAAVASLVGFANARRTARVVSVDVPIADLPPALDGFTIVQISDVHVGATIRRRYVEAIVARANSLQADFVAVTGDLVDGAVAELAEHVAPLAGLSSRHGTFFVTGNHEYYSGVHAWTAEVGRLGMRVLLNEHVVLEHGDARLVLAGVADYTAHHFDPAHRSDPAAAIAGAPPDASVRVLLAHQPRSAEAAARAGFDLQLSGHTHGGQFLPWNLLVRLQQPFTAGLARLQELWVYTSRGTGYWGPPKRVGARSEITRLRLVRAPG